MLESDCIVSRRFVEPESASDSQRQSSGVEKGAPALVPVVTNKPGLCKSET